MAMRESTSSGLSTRWKWCRASTMASRSMKPLFCLSKIWNAFRRSFAPRGFRRELLAQNPLRVIRGNRLRRRDGRCLTLLELLQLSAEPVDEIPLRLLHRGVGEILLVFNHRVPERLGGDETLATFVAQFPDPSHELGVRVGTEHVPGVGEEEGPAFGGGGGGERLPGPENLAENPSLILASVSGRCRRGYPRAQSRRRSRRRSCDRWRGPRSPRRARRGRPRVGR